MPLTRPIPDICADALGGVRICVPKPEKTPIRTGYQDARTGQWWLKALRWDMMEHLACPVSFGALCALYLPREKNGRLRDSLQYSLWKLELWWNEQADDPQAAVDAIWGPEEPE